VGEARDRSVEVAVNGRTLAVVRGDITRVPADAIVNAANEHLVGGGGVDGAIHRAGGPAIMRALEENYGRDRRCPTGSAVVTAAGALPAKWVIHAVGPRWSGGRRGEADLLRAAYASALAEAESLDARSITFPAISCGIYGYPIDQGAAIALDLVSAYLARAESSIERATFVLFSEETLGEFSTQLQRLSSA
jgi:O-acetyl-ADP-ribose deacetylase (regulator of RNase III)